MNEKEELHKPLDEAELIPDYNFDHDPDFTADVIKGSFVQDILSIMKQKNISQSVLAEKMGKSRQYVSRRLKEKGNFTIESLAAFSCALDCILKIEITQKDEISTSAETDKGQSMVSGI